jgi:flagellin
MSSTINTNINSITAQRNAGKSQNDLTTAISRLSSGLRINSARDDAAGLAIADRFTSQIKGINQAARNANDGISLAQTAEGSLASVGDNLQRIRELSVQSANATNSASDRSSLQQEVSQLVSEINRVATQTSFNGTNLLDGSFANKVFQVGANSGQTISVGSIADARTSSLGSSYTANVTGAATTSTALTAGALTLNGTSIQAATAGTSAGQAATSAWAVAQAINGSQGAVVATANATTNTGSAPAAAGAIAANAFSVNGVNIGAIAAGGSVALQGANVAAAINQVSAASGVTASANASTGAVTLTAADGRNIDVAGDVTNTGLTAQTNYGTVTLATNSTTATSIVVGGTAPTTAGFTAATTASALTGTALANIDISTVAGANTALASVDSALSAVSTSRAALGAIQNRFSSTIDNLHTTSENLSASRSRIQDADFAMETANLSRAQVLQQAGTAMIAQANQLPQQVLALLR